MRARYWGLLITQHRREFYAMYNIERVGNSLGGVKTYLPLLQEGKRITPLFPSYLFVQFRREVGWKWAASVLGVKSVVGGENLTIVSNDIIKDLKSRETDGAVVLKPLVFEDGEAVKVTHGPFIGQNAIYEGMSGTDRAFVLMSIMGKEVRTVVKATALAPA